jgi:hypothetical protein
MLLNAVLCVVALPGVRVFLERFVSIVRLCSVHQKQLLGCFDATLLQWSAAAGGRELQLETSSIWKITLQLVPFTCNPGSGIGCGGCWAWVFWFGTLGYQEFYQQCGCVVCSHSDRKGAVLLRCAVAAAAGGRELQCVSSINTEDHVAARTLHLRRRLGLG